MRRTVPSPPMGAPAGSTPEESIRNLLAAYCQTVDDGRFDEWEQLWTTDATFSVVGRVHSGRAALRAFIEAAQPPHRRGRHVVTSSVIAVDGETAEVTSDFLFLAAGADGSMSVTQVGRYLDTASRVEGRWLLSSREVVLGLEPDAAQAMPG